jgi:hypothetical protein
VLCSPLTRQRPCTDTQPGDRTMTGSSFHCFPKANASCGGADAPQSVCEPSRLASHIVNRRTVERKKGDEMATGLFHKPRNDRRLNLIQILDNHHSPGENRCLSLAFGRVKIWKAAKTTEPPARSPATTARSHRRVRFRSEGAEVVSITTKKSIASPEVSVVQVTPESPQAAKYATTPRHPVWVGRPQSHGSRQAASAGSAS